MTPKNDSANTYGGVLTRPAAVVVATLVALAAVATVGWKARDFVERAEARPVNLDGLDDIRADLRDVKRDVLLIKCRMGIDGVCPAPNVAASSIGR